MASMSTTALLEQIRSRAGNDNARVATDDDAFDGVHPRLVFEPQSSEAVAPTLAWASSEQLKVQIVGGRSKEAWGVPSGPVDLLFSTACLRSVVEHRHGDLTATVEAGATLASVNTTLAAHRQWLPWDPPWMDRATIGGIVATNDSGPRRHGYGTPRDSIIGVTIARIDGEVAKAGGIVVKNVAGYDLSRLLTGSFGSLGVIITATFKLAPIPSVSRTLIVELSSLEVAEPVVAELASSALTPTALELIYGHGVTNLLVRFESVEEAAAQQATEASIIVGERGACRIVEADDEAALWQRHATHWDTGGTLVKMSCLPSELMETLAWLRDAADASRLELAVAGRGGLGVLDVRLNGSLELQASLITELRGRFAVGRGSAVIRRGDVALRQMVDVWGSLGDGAKVMRAVKQRFDSRELLNTERGPGGL